MDIKVVTINTWKCEGDYRRRMQALSQQLKQTGAQVIACQECFLSEDGKTDTLGWLAGQLNMSAAFLPGRFKKRYFEGTMVAGYSGLGLLSRFPMGIREDFDLPAVPGDEDRKVQRVELTIAPGKKLVIINTHLTHLQHAGSWREQQVYALCNRFLRNEEIIITGRGMIPGSERNAVPGELPDEEAEYTLVCGDFNAGPASKEIALLQEKGQLADAYILGGGKEPRTSLLEAAQRGIPYCVDHIFCRRMHSSASSYPLFKKSSVVLNEPDTVTGLYPSDHFGIVTTMVTL